MALITRKSLLSVGLLLTVACNEPTAAPAIVSVTVTPSGDTILVARAVQLMATTRDVSGNTLTGHTVTWTSSNSTVAIVSVSGLVTGVSAGGPVTVTATSEGKSGTAAIAVIPAPTVSVYPNTIATVVGGSVFFEALLDSAGKVEVLNGPVTWASTNPAVATARDTLDESVPQGFVTGVSTGSAMITATTRLGPATATISVAQVTFAALSSGGDHSCGLTTTGTAFCWGNDDYGALGASIAIDFTRCLFLDVANVPCSAAPIGVTGGLGFAAISAGIDRDGGSTCALTASGTAYCWGQNGLGELGNGTTDGDFHVVPTLVRGGLTFASISVGGPHACGLTTTGAVSCWGWNSGGQLGSGDTVSHATPTPVVGGLTFAAISAGNLHSCALATDGTAYCWGWNSWPYMGHGWLGTGDTINRVAPTPVMGGLTFAAISAGGRHTCALTTNGAAYCWGFNGAGQLGTGDDVTKTIPTPVVGGFTFTAISAGSLHTCGLTTSGLAYCWGHNFDGQLGTGNPVPQAMPTAVIGGLRFAAISASDAHTCGLTTSGAAYCWGDGYWGQLGNGTYRGSSIPTKVLGQP